MSRTLGVAADLLREALARRWFLGLGIAITLVLATMALSLKLDVVDGALAGIRLFGRDAKGASIQAVDVAMRPLFVAATFLVFYGGTAFMVLACSDFAPSLLSPGRIEHLLALPLRRHQLLFGTWLGVMALALLATLYGAGGLTLILGVKTDTWTARPVIAALLATVSFSAIYAAMLAAALFVRSAAVSAAVGGVVFVAGIVAGYRADLAPMFEAGAGRASFKAATLLMPRVSALAESASRIASHEPIDLRAFAGTVGGCVVFAVAALAIGAWKFEQKDF